VTETPLVSAQRLLAEAVDALGAAAGNGAGDEELLSVLAVCEATGRRLDKVVVDTVAALQRRSAFTDRGDTSTAAALADLLGWERFEARRRTVAAEQVTPRTGLDGAPLPARLPATAAVFAAGRASLRHVEMIARVLATRSAQRGWPRRPGRPRRGSWPPRRACTPRPS
jgi:Domain of unknown function (DUF222)